MFLSRSILLDILKQRTTDVDIKKYFLRCLEEVRSSYILNRSAKIFVLIIRCLFLVIVWISGVHKKRTSKAGSKVSPTSRLIFVIHT